MITFSLQENASRVLTDHIITSVSVTSIGGHDNVHVFNRGGNAGTLIVNLGDGCTIARKLLPDAIETTWEDIKWPR